MADMLGRMTKQQRRSELLRHLTGEVLKEMLIPSIEEWQIKNPQGVLF